MPRIFLSYRRDDAGQSAGRLCDRLSACVGRDHVFMDIGSIEAGVDFVDKIEEAVSSSEVLLVLIGRHWLESRNREGKRRLDDAGDYVRFEITSALDRKIRVIPILVDGVTMPAAADLPPELEPLTRLNAVELSLTRWDDDVRRLMDALGIAEPPAPAPPLLQRRVGPAPVWLLLLGLAIALASGIGYLASRLATPTPGEPQLTDIIPTELRPSAAVAGFNNVRGLESDAWISTALAEFFTTELGAGDRVRMVEQARVSEARGQRGLHQDDEPTAEVLQSLRRLLGVDVVVGGSFTRLDEGGSLRLNLRMWDAVTGELLSSEPPVTFTEAEIPSLARTAGLDFRKRLGAEELSAREKLWIEASLPAGIEAVRSYSEGLDRRRRFDDAGALEKLEAARSADPEHPLIRSELAATLWALGYTSRAQAETEKAVELSRRLAPKEQAVLKAFHSETLENWDQAVQIYDTLFRANPDDVTLGLKLAYAQVSGERITEAQVTLEALRKLPEPASKDPRIDYAQARVHEELGEFEELREVAARTARVASETGSDLLVAEARLREAVALQALGRADAAETVIDEAQKLFQAHGDRRGVARAIEAKAQTEYQRENLRLALALFLDSLNTYLEIGDRAGEARLASNIGVIQLEAGQLDQARSSFDRSLALYEELGAKPDVEDVGIALMNLGVNHHLSGELSQAMDYYQQALPIFDRVGDGENMALTRTNLAEIYYLRGDLDTALGMHEEADRLWVKAGSRDGRAYNTMRLGMVLAAKGDSPLARAKLRDALDLYQKLGSSYGAGEATLMLAELSLATGAEEEAVKLARQAEQELAGVEGADDLAALARTVLALAFAATGATREAEELTREVAVYAETSGDQRVRFAAATAAAAIRGASGGRADSTAALAALDEVSRDARKKGFLGYALEAELAAGEIDLEGGGKTRLQRLLTEARERGFGQIAQRAERALGLQGTAKQRISAPVDPSRSITASLPSAHKLSPNTASSSAGESPISLSTPRSRGRTASGKSTSATRLPVNGSRLETRTAPSPRLSAITASPGPPTPLPSPMTSRSSAKYFLPSLTTFSFSPLRASFT